MNTNRTTHILLSLIAILLLINVFQNYTYRPSPTNMGKAPAPSLSHQGFDDDPHAGHDHGDPHGEAPMDFNPGEMILAALNCPEDATLLLGDPGCTGSKSEGLKKFVAHNFEQGLSISKIFDTVIAKYGEGALTQQARDIRKQMKQK